jgi:hypothetical protein
MTMKLVLVVPCTLLLVLPQAGNKTADEPSPPSSQNTTTTQTDHSTRSDVRWLNIRGCPLQIEMLKNRRFIFVRNSDKRAVVSYQLGCAKKTPKGLVVTSQFSLDSIRIPPGEGLFSSRDRFEEGGRSYCAAQDTALVVTRVDLEDGSRWVIPPRDAEVMPSNDPGPAR